MGWFIEKTARLQLHKTCEAERNHTRIHYDTQEYVENTNRHTLSIIIFAEVVEVVVNVVLVKATKEGAAQSVFAGRTSINPLTEETQTVRILPVSVALVRARDRHLVKLHA